MDISKLIAAYLISQGAHTGGHFYEAGRRDVPISLDARNLVENWDIPDKWRPAKKGDPLAGIRMSHEDYLADNNRKAADIHGAGFAMQDRARDMMTDPDMKSKVAGMNALIKGLYLAGAPMKLSQQLNQSGGDIGGMENTSGNHYTKALLAASILGDLYAAKNPKSRVSYSFNVIDGAPGGRVNFYW